MRTVRLRIEGRVQGVGYRVWAIETAAGLGLRGWVRNRVDGSVEIRVSGTPPAITVLIEACEQGPRGALVARVAVTDEADDGSTGFAARPTE